MTTFAERLHYAVKESGLTQCEVAEAAGATPSAVSQYLSGINIPKPERLRALADATGVPVAFLNGEQPIWIEEQPIPARDSTEITVDMVARCLHMSSETVKANIESGKLPIGLVLKTRGTKRRFIINPDKLLDVIGETLFYDFFGKFVQRKEVEQMSEWKVCTQKLGEQKIYQVWRQTRKLRLGEPMHSGVREYASGLFDTKEAAQEYADSLNQKRG